MELYSALDGLGIETVLSKAPVYEALHAVNQNFEQILTDLLRLEKLGFRRELVHRLQVVI